MNIRRLLLRISNAISYVGAFLYFLAFGGFLSVSNGICYLFVALAVASLISGLLISTVVDRMDGTDFDEKQYRFLWIYSAINVASPISFALDLAAILIKDRTPLKHKEIIKPSLVDNEVEDKKKPFFKRRNVIGALASLGAIILSSFAGMMVENDGFKVDVKDYTLTKEMSERYSAPINDKQYIIKTDRMKYAFTVYKPKEASAENKLPCVFVAAGYGRIKEAMSHFGIELSRRGAVAILYDSAVHGASTYAGSWINSKGEEALISTSDQQWGLNYVISYVYNNVDDFDYVDRDRFGATGHSQGGAAVEGAACNMSGGSFEKSILKAIQISGYCTNLNYYSGLLRCNTLLTWGLYEEGYPQGGYEDYFVRFVNNQNGYGTAHYQNIEYNKAYGDKSDGSYRMVTRPKAVHYTTIYDTENIAQMCDFFNETLDMKSSLKGSSQTWIIHEVTGLISFVASFFMIVYVAAILISYKPFSFVRNRKADDLPKYVAAEDGSLRKKPQSVYSKLKFWISTVLTGVIACFDYDPCVKLGIQVFDKTIAGQYSFMGPSKTVNGVMFWALFNGIIGLLIFFVPKIIEHFVYKRKGTPEAENKESLEPLKMGLRKTLLTIGLAIGLFLLYFGFLWVIKSIFHQEYRVLVIVAEPLRIRHIVTFLLYLVPFSVFYISNSIRVNCGIGFEGWSERKTKLVAVLANTLGLAMILFIEYSKFVQVGQLYYPDVTYYNPLYGVIIMMALLPLLNRAFYKKTNQVWLGALVAVMIIIYINVSGGANLVPVA